MSKMNLKQPCQKTHPMFEMSQIIGMHPAEKTSKPPKHVLRTVQCVIKSGRTVEGEGFAQRSDFPIIKTKSWCKM